MEEIWKDIPGYEGYYQASNFGRVKRLERTFTRNNGKSEFAKFHINERIKSIQKQTQGYSQVCLSKDGDMKTIRLNTLIARMFVDNPEEKPCVNHIDGNKDNNRADNLEWVTNSENILHAYRTGLIVHYTRKVAQFDLNGNKINEFNSLKEAAETVKGWHKGTICTACKNGKLAYGYYWKYIDNE